MSLHGGRATMVPREWSTEGIKREITSCSDPGFKGQGLTAGQGLLTGKDNPSC